MIRTMEKDKLGDSFENSSYKFYKVLINMCQFLDRLFLLILFMVFMVTYLHAEFLCDKSKQYL